MSEFKTNSVKRSTLSQQIMEHFVLQLIEGNLQPGSKVPSEFTLMEEFNVSRTVLREALMALETLEIIERKPREGTFINNRVSKGPFTSMLALSINNIPAVIEARIILELGLVTLAAEKITEKQLDELNETIEQIKKTPDDDYGGFDKNFHRIIAFSVDNPVVEGMVSSLLIAHEKTDSLIPYREPEKTIKHHERIYKALQKRNSFEAFQKMYEHLDFVRKKILSNLENGNNNS